MSKNGLKIEKLLEKRQLSKIEPLSPLNLPEHLDAKTTKKVLALRRKELKLQQQARYIEAAKEVGLGSVAAIIYSGGQALKAGIDGVFGIGKAIAENPDPVAQGVAIAGGIVVLAWFDEAFPGLAHKLHLDVFPGLQLGGVTQAITPVQASVQGNFKVYTFTDSTRASQYVQKLKDNGIQDQSISVILNDKTKNTEVWIELSVKRVNQDGSVSVIGYVNIPTP